MRKFNKDSKLILTILVLVGILTLGYATLGANLRINGVANIPSSSWDVHFKTGSITPTNGSVTIDTSNNEQAATIDSATQVSYAVKLALPGDFYEFTVQVENTGSIDAMIDSISSKLGTTEITTGTLPSYINYSVAYSDGTPIATKQILAANGGTETIKVRIEFKEDISANDLPGTAETLNLNFQLNYVQADNTAVAVNRPTSVYTINNSSNKVRVGYEIPNGVTTYSTPELAMAAAKQLVGGTKDRTFLKHTVLNGIVQESYVGFIITNEVAQSYSIPAGTYYIKGEITKEKVNNTWVCKSECDDGNGNCIAPSYSTNVETLSTVLGSIDCEESSTSYHCEYDTWTPGANVNKNGSVYAGDDDWDCDITDGYSYCEY